MFYCCERKNVFNAIFNAVKQGFNAVKWCFYAVKWCFIAVKEYFNAMKECFAPARTQRRYLKAIRARKFSAMPTKFSAKIKF